MAHQPAPRCGALLGMSTCCAGHLAVGGSHCGDGGVAAGVLRDCGPVCYIGI